MTQYGAKSLSLGAPNNIIFELFSTIVKEIPGERLLDYIRDNLKDYLTTNWTNKTLQRAIQRLKREQAVDIKAGLSGVPVIRSVSRDGSSRKVEKSPPITDVRSDRQVIQIHEHIMWRIRSENVTQITSLIVKLAIDDGYKRAKLKAELYEDVVDCFRDWRSNKSIKLYSFGNAPANDQKLILANTTGGDITKWVANYIDGSEKRQRPELIRKLAGALRDKTKNCIYITHDLGDGLRSLQTGSIRCVLLVDRLKQYEQIRDMPEYSTSIEPLIAKKQLYIISSLDCITFVVDPSAVTACC